MRFMTGWKTPGAPAVIRALGTGRGAAGCAGIDSCMIDRVAHAAERPSNMPRYTRIRSQPRLTDDIAHHRSNAARRNNWAWRFAARKDKVPHQCDRGSSCGATLSCANAISGSETLTKVHMHGLETR